MVLALALRRARAIAASAAVAAASLAGQSRATELVGAPALGATCYVRHVLPAGCVGHVAGFLWSAPYTGTWSLPGFAANGLVRVDPSSFLLLGLALTDGVDLPRMPLAVPSSSALLGSQLDCQSFDLDLAGVWQLAGNDVALTVVDGPSAALDMVAIPPGTFVMGSAMTPLAVAPYFNQAEAQPPHVVTISRPFWIGRHEVTQTQFQAVMGSNQSYFQGSAWANAPQRPVERLNWLQAVAYCAALTASEQAAGRVPAGYEYRLPTEAEWEYCCRAGTTTEFHVGPTLVCGQANFFFSYHGSGNCSSGQTAVVGSYPPNAWGLCDLHGNVWEWCHDAWDGTANYPPGPVVDPVVASGPSRVARGGSWIYDSRGCRSAFRFRSLPTYADFSFGCRVVLAPAIGS
ncbi:MAG: formylglycine-generating enzyme family protein [Planctomycetota bacterium]